MNPFLPVLIITPILLLLSLMIVVFVLRYQKRLIAHQNYLKELQEARQRQVLEAALEAQEAERRRLSRDLHDEVGAMLSLIKLQVGQMCNLVPEKKTASETGTVVKQQLNEVISSVRRISHNLMPVVLEMYGLIPALESLKKSLPPASGLKMDFSYNNLQSRLNPKLELCIFRVIQELLNNTLKHGVASIIKFRLDSGPEKITVYYSDNGKGFRYIEQTDGQQAISGLGLTNMRSRVELLNGSFSFNSDEGAGVQATLVLPIN